MSIDVDAEDLIPFCEARTAFPGGKRLSLATLHRWRLHGVRGTKLETCLVGGMRYTSAQAIRRFFAAQNAVESPTSSFTPSQRQKQAEAANKILTEALAAQNTTESRRSRHQSGIRRKPLAVRADGDPP